MFLLNDLSNSSHKKSLILFYLKVVSFTSFAKEQVKDISLASTGFF